MDRSKRPLQFRQFFFFLAGALFLSFLDQLSKRWALDNLGDHEPVKLIGDILWFLRIENTGAAFGILKGHMEVFYLITAVVTAAIFYMVLTLPPVKRSVPLLVTLTFLWAGALGNLIDRTFRKSVVDFIYFVPIDFPVFNVADIFVTCSTAALMLLFLFYYKEDEVLFPGSGKDREKS